MYFSKQKNYIYIVLCLLFMSSFLHVMSLHVEDLSKRNFSRQKNRCRFCARERPAITGTSLTLVQMFMSCFPHVMSQQVEDLSKRNLPKQKNERFCIRERLLMQALLWPLSSAFFSCYVFLMWGVNKWKIYLGKFFPSDKKEKDVEKDC